jgi:cation diffusion facilitator family transporter
VTSSPDRTGESLRTVLTAITANILIAVAKGAAALITGSAALWAETLHSLADSGNEILLLVGLSRSKKQVDPQHPFGNGQERYFWAFLAALGIFLIGGVLSIGEGVRSLVEPEPITSRLIGIGVLLVAACLEGYSWMVSRRQLRSRARDLGRTIRQHLNRASDPSAPTVFLEDSAALVGIAIALSALILHMVTGDGVWDAAASIGIGVLLIVVAFLLARRSEALLIDESAPSDIVDPIRQALVRPEWVVDVHQLEAIFIGPARLLVIARIDVVAKLRDAPAREVLRHLEQLRHDLLRSPAIAEASIGVADRPRDTGAR